MKLKDAAPSWIIFLLQSVNVVKVIFFLSIATVHRQLNSINVWSPKMEDYFRKMELLILKQENQVKKEQNGKKNKINCPQC